MRTEEKGVYMLYCSHVILILNQSPRRNVESSMSTLNHLIQGQIAPGQHPNRILSL